MRSKEEGNQRLLLPPGLKVSMCKWPDNQKDERHIDLFYHLSEVFDVQIETSKEGGNLKWEKLVEEAKCQEHVGQV